MEGFTQAMAATQRLTQTKLKLINRFFPDACEATVETLEILMDMDQVSTLLMSMDEVRCGKIISFENAFADV